MYLYFKIVIALCALFITVVTIRLCFNKKATIVDKVGAVLVVLLFYGLTWVMFTAL